MKVNRNAWLIFACVSVAMLSSTSCKHTRLVESSTKEKDTIFVERKYIERDTVLIVPGSIATLSVPCPEAVFKNGLNTVSKKTGHATIRVTKESGSLNVACVCDTNAIKAKLRDYYEKIYHKKETEKITLRETRVIPPLIKWSAISFWLLIVLVLIILINHIIKKIKNESSN